MVWGRVWAVCAGPERQTIIPMYITPVSVPMVRCLKRVRWKYKIICGSIYRTGNEIFNVVTDRTG